MERVVPRIRLPRPFEPRQDLVDVHRAFPFPLPLPLPPSQRPDHPLEERQRHVVVVMSSDALPPRVKALDDPLHRKHPDLGRQVLVDALCDRAPVWIGLEQPRIAFELHRDDSRKAVHALVRPARPRPVDLPQAAPVGVQDAARTVDGLLEHVFDRELPAVVELDVLLRRLLLQATVRRTVVANKQRDLPFAQTHGGGFRVLRDRDRERPGGAGRRGRVGHGRPSVGERSRSHNHHPGSSAGSSAVHRKAAVTGLGLRFA